MREIAAMLPQPVPSTAYELMLAIAQALHSARGGVDESGLDHGAFDSWSKVVASVEVQFRGSDGAITAADINWINGTRTDGLDELDWLHAVGHGLDLATWPTFSYRWEEILNAGGFHRLGEGEWYPVSDWQLDPPPNQDWSVRPSAENVVPGEFQHVRRWTAVGFPKPGPLEVEFHFDAAREVRAAGEAEVVATLHANSNDDEFEIPNSSSMFPVKPSSAVQGARIVSALEAASKADAELVVGGEVSLTGNALEDVQEWLDRNWVSAPALVVPGSLHHLIDSEPANTAFALRSRKVALEHRKIVPYEQSTSTRKRPTREGIVPGPKLLKVWVGGWVRFAMVICRDLLDSNVRHAIMRAGINLLAVPTFSDEMSSYPIHVGSVCLANQGRIAVANNPSHFSGDAVAPLAVFGQPLGGRSAQGLSPVLGPTHEPVVGIDVLGAEPAWIEVT
jgi:predicted amidohydrolase